MKTATTTILAAVLAAVLSLGTGCRAVYVSNETANNYNGGRDVFVTGSGQESVQDGAQEAGKDFGSAFSGNKPETAVGPLSRTGGSTGDNTAAP